MRASSPRKKNSRRKGETLSRSNSPNRQAFQSQVLLMDFGAEEIGYDSFQIELTLSGNKSSQKTINVLSPNGQKRLSFNLSWVHDYSISKEEPNSKVMVDLSEAGRFEFLFDLKDEQQKTVFTEIARQLEKMKDEIEEKKPGLRENDKEQQTNGLKRALEQIQKKGATFWFSQFGSFLNGEAPHQNPLAGAPGALVIEQISHNCSALSVYVLDKDKVVLESATRITNCFVFEIEAEGIKWIDNSQAHPKIKRFIWINESPTTQEKLNDALAVALSKHDLKVRGFLREDVYSSFKAKGAERTKKLEKEMRPPVQMKFKGAQLHSYKFSPVQMRMIEDSVGSEIQSLSVNNSSLILYVCTATNFQFYSNHLEHPKKEKILSFPSMAENTKEEPFSSRKNGAVHFGAKTILSQNQPSIVYMLSSSFYQIKTERSEVSFQEVNLNIPGGLFLIDFDIFNDTIYFLTRRNVRVYKEKPGKSLEFQKEVSFEASTSQLAIIKEFDILPRVVKGLPPGLVAIGFSEGTVRVYNVQKAKGELAFAYEPSHPSPVKHLGMNSQICGLIITYSSHIVWLPVLTKEGALSRVYRLRLGVESALEFGIKEVNFINAEFFIPSGEVAQLDQKEEIQLLDQSEEMYERPSIVAALAQGIVRWDLNQFSSSDVASSQFFPSREPIVNSLIGSQDLYIQHHFHVSQLILEN